MKVIIPAACYNSYQIDAASFVFKTIRTGFPTADIVLVIGNTVPMLRDAIIEAAVGAWINPARNDNYADRPLVDVYTGFLQTEEKPFFYCDTDIVFWDSIESHLPEFEEVSLAGRYIPKFFERFTRCVTMPRLHSSLLYLNPLRVRREIEEYHRSLGPETSYTPRPDLFRPIFVSCKEADGGRVVTKKYFYDVLAMAYHALPGAIAFSESVNACFDHLTCGSVAHLVGPEYGVDLVEMHRAAMRDPQTIKGLWLKQRAAYERGALELLSSDPG